MHKLMCLDVGTKRIGVALSDFLHITVSGCCCIAREPEKEAIKQVQKLVSENRVESIVIGIPINMDGTEGFQAENCKEFAKKLKENIPEISVIFEDERLTSDLAEENLRNKKIDFRKDKSLVDIESACIILEQYINKHAN